MGDVKEIKDRAPNLALVEQIERILSDAKEGRIRSAIWVTSWSDGSVTHGWAYDVRSSRRRILSEITLLQHDYIVDTGFSEGDSCLANAFEEWD